MKNRFPFRLSQAGAVAFAVGFAVQMPVAHADALSDLAFLLPFLARVSEAEATMAEAQIQQPTGIFVSRCRCLRVSLRRSFPNILIPQCEK